MQPDNSVLDTNLQIFDAGKKKIDMSSGRLEQFWAKLWKVQNEALSNNYFVTSHTKHIVFNEGKSEKYVYFWINVKSYL